MLTPNVFGDRPSRTNPEDWRKHSDFAISPPHISEVNLVEVELGTYGGSSCCQRLGCRTTEDSCILDSFKIKTKNTAVELA